MIADPYKVLGVSENVSDADLKKTYRELSKKWHPDANPNNQQAAEERFKEIQEAYRQIVDARAKGTSAYGTAQNTSGNYGGYSSSGSGGGYQDYGNYGGFGGFEEFFSQWSQYSDERRSQENSNELNAARNYINNGYYQEAMTALEQVDQSLRGARWYYFAAVASQGLGNNINAMTYAKKACDLEPGNAEYANLLNRLQNGGTWYQDRGTEYGGFGSMDPQAKWCLSLCAINLLCGGCCRGPVFFC